MKTGEEQWDIPEYSRQTDTERGGGEEWKHRSCQSQTNKATVSSPEEQTCEDRPGSKVPSPPQHYSSVDFRSDNGSMVFICQAEINIYLKYFYMSVNVFVLYSSNNTVSSFISI